MEHTGHNPIGEYWGGEKESGWALAELQAINEVAEAVSRYLDLDSVLEVGLDAALRAVGLSKGWIRLYTEAGELKVRAVRGLGPEHLVSLMTLKETEGVCGAAVERGQSVVIHGAPEDPAEIFPSLKRHGFNSYLGTPLMLHGRIRGILVVTSMEPFRFSARQVGLLKVIAAQLAVAIEHAYLHDAVERERARREEELENSRAFIQATIDALPAHICVLDERGIIVFANEAWFDFVRQGIADPQRCGLGVDYLGVCHQATCAGDALAGEAAQGIEAVLSGKSEGFSLDYPCHSPDQERYFQMRAVALHAPGGRRVVVAHHDVTENKRAEQETQRALEELRAVDQLKDDFVSGITHDLKTPLVPVSGFLDIVLSGRAGPLNERQKTFLTHSLSGVARLTNMIDDLLEASRIRAGKLRFEPEPLDVRGVLSEALQFLALIARDRHLAVEAHLPEEPLRVQGEARKLARIFHNLFSNAVRYNVEGGRVEVRAWAEGAKVLVSVKDSGIGVAPEDKGRIFERFYQAPGRRGGAGLGLSVVKEMLRLHRGEVKLDTEPGKGSTFTVIFPRLDEAAAT